MTVTASTRIPTPTTQTGTTQTGTTHAGTTQTGTTQTGTTQMGTTGTARSAAWTSGRPLPGSVYAAMDRAAHSLTTRTSLRRLVSASLPRTSPHSRSSPPCSLRAPVPPSAAAR